MFVQRNLVVEIRTRISNNVTCIAKELARTNRVHHVPKAYARNVAAVSVRMDMLKMTKENACCPITVAIVIDLSSQMVVSII